MTFVKSRYDGACHYIKHKIDCRKQRSFVAVSNTRDTWWDCSILATPSWHFPWHRSKCFGFKKHFPARQTYDVNLESSSQNSVFEEQYFLFWGVESHPPYLLGRTIVLQYKFNTLENKHLCATFHNRGGCSLTNTFLIVWFVISWCRFFIF